MAESDQVVIAFVSLAATGLPHIVARVLYLQWLVGVQPVTCLLLGLAVARRTGRALLPWFVTGLLAGAVPVAGYLIMAGAWFWYPPATPARPADAETAGRERADAS
jgi:hypothetical protein